MNSNIIILANLGRSAVCNIHVLILNTHKVIGPEYFMNTFRAIESIEIGNQSSRVQEACLAFQASMDEDDFGLWNHHPIEWLAANSPKSVGHELCSCRTPVPTDGPVFFHAHNLFIDRALFESLGSVRLKRQPSLKFLVPTRSFLSNAKNMMRHQDLVKWGVRSLYLAYVCLVLNTGQRNLHEIKKHFSVYLLTLENLHSNFYEEFSRIMAYMGIPDALPPSPAGKLTLQNQTWTGGSDGGQFSPERLHSADYEQGDPIEEAIISAFDRESGLYGRPKQFLIRFFFLALADFCALVVTIGGVVSRSRLTPPSSHEAGQSRSTSRIERVIQGLSLIPGVPYLFLRFYSRWRFALARARLRKFLYK